MLRNRPVLRRGTHRRGPRQHMDRPIHGSALGFSADLRILQCLPLFLAFLHCTEWRFVFRYVPFELELLVHTSRG